MALGNTGITTTAVANELGTSNHNVGGLCTSSLVNMWSRCKPVHITSAVPDRSGLWWRGTNLNCGLNYPTTTSYINIPALYTNDLMNGWSYDKPRGGSSSPYRLADFMYYKHDALPPYRNFNCPDEVSKTGTLVCSMMQPEIVEDKTGAGNICVDDIGDLESYTFGILVTDTSGTIKGRVAGGTAGSISYDVSGLTLNSSYYVYPFLAKTSMTLNSSDVANTYIPVPNVGKATFKVVSPEQAAGLTISLRATKLSTTIRYFITISIENGSRTFSNNSIYCKFTTSSEISSPLDGENSKNLGSITVTAGTPYTSSGSFSNLKENKSYYIYLTINTGQYTRKVTPMAANPDNPTTPV